MAGAKGDAQKKAEAARDRGADERKNVAKLDAPPALPAPAPVPAPDPQRLLESGVISFRNGDFGLAILRFRQLAEGDPPVIRGVIYARAELYRRWQVPRSDGGSTARPQTPGRLASKQFSAQARALRERRGDLAETGQPSGKGPCLQPQNADPLFLLGYMSWFGGVRDAAVDYFRQSRALAGRAMGRLILEGRQIGAGTIRTSQYRNFFSTRNDSRASLPGGAGPSPSRHPFSYFAVRNAFPFGHTIGQRTNCLLTREP